ncbi:hypothetical protein FRC17_005919, partial [Serendipita sp. 399]
MALRSEDGQGHHPTEIPRSDPVDSPEFESGSVTMLLSTSRVHIRFGLQSWAISGTTPWERSFREAPKIHYWTTAMRSCAAPVANPPIDSKITAEKLRTQTTTSANHLPTTRSTLTDSEIATVEGQLSTALSAFEAQSADTIAAAAVKRSAIPIVWHVIYTSKTVAGGYISNSAVKKSISAMNSHYKGSGFGFKLKQIKRKKNTNWFKKIKGTPNNSYLVAMKKALHTGGAGTLNIYSVKFADGTLGIATFPWDYYGHEKLDGVVIQYNSYPGGSLKHYNQGKTLTHEVGHWLGVYHPFQGNSCNGMGDYVVDTPQQ